MIAYAPTEWCHDPKTVAKMYGETQQRKVTPLFTARQVRNKFMRLYFWPVFQDWKCGPISLGWNWGTTWASFFSEKCFTKKQAGWRISAFINVDKTWPAGLPIREKVMLVESRLRFLKCNSDNAVRVAVVVFFSLMLFWFTGPMWFQQAT